SGSPLAEARSVPRAIAMPRSLKKLRLTPAVAASRGTVSPHGPLDATRWSSSSSSPVKAARSSADRGRIVVSMDSVARRLSTLRAAPRQGRRARRSGASEPCAPYGDTMVFFRRSDVISAGDILNTNRYPRFDPERGGGIDGIIEGLNLILDIAIA